MNFKSLTPVVFAVAAALAAAEPVLEQLDDSALEDLFWTCDVQATQVALPAADGMLCSMASDELKQRRFDGDFTALLAWWHERKAAEHAGRTATFDAEDPTLQAP